MAMSKDPIKRQRQLDALTPINKRPKAEADAIRRKGGQALAAKKRKKKLFKETLLALLDAEIYDKDPNDKRKKKIDGWEAMGIRLVNIAIKSTSDNDAIKAIMSIRDTIGQKPKEEIDINQTVYEDFVKSTQDDEEY